MVDKSDDLSINKGAELGSCTNCRSEAFVAIYSSTVAFGITASIAFSAHTHGQYSLDYKNRNAPSNFKSFPSRSIINHPSSSDRVEAGLRPGVISSSYGYTIYSYKNAGQIFSYQGKLLENKNK